jgi:hypothetical protein
MCQLHYGTAALFVSQSKLSTDKFQLLDCPAVHSVLEEKPYCTKVLRTKLLVIQDLFTPEELIYILALNKAQPNVKDYHLALLDHKAGLGQTDQKSKRHW